MRNEANFSKSQMFITSIKTTNYNKKWTMDTWSKRTQSKPIQTHFEPDANPKQTQSNQIALAEEGFEGAVVGFSCAEEGNFGEFYDPADVVEA